MRVIHVIPSVSPKRGGPSLAVLAMVRALRAQGVEAEIATTDDDGEGVLNVRFDELSDHEGVPVRFFRRYSPPMRAMLIPALAQLRHEPIYFALVGNAEPPDYEAEVAGMLAAARLTARTRRVPFAAGEWKPILLQ